MIELIEWEDYAITAENLGDRVRVLRSARDMTQLELANEAEVSQYSVFAMEHGRNPTFFTVLRVIDALGCELAIRRKA